MADKKFVGTFETENQVLNKIEDLKAEGYSEGDIYAITNDKDTFSILRGQTDIDLQSAEGNWFDRFMAFLSGEEPVQNVFHHMGFTEEESSRYYDDIRNGYILLYVDKDNGSFFTDQQLQSGYIDHNLGSNLTVNDLDNTTLSHNGMNIDVGHEERLRLHEEKVLVDKERVQAGEVNINKHVVEDEQTVEVPVSREEVNIERRAVLDETAAGEVFDDGENLHIPIMEERIEVTKRPVVNEEIVVSKHNVQDTETVRETVRREEADIDRTDDIVTEYDRAKDSTFEKDLFGNHDPLNDQEKF